LLIMLDGLTLDQMRVFMAVAESGSFRAAALQLNRAQSAVSHAIANLEAQLGLKLFLREGLHRPVLTDHGRVLRADVCAVLRRVDALKAKARGLGEAVELELTIAVDSVFPPARIAEALAKLQERYPLVAVRVLRGVLGVGIQALRQRRAALAITSSVHLPDPVVQHEPLGRVRLVAVAAPTHPLAQLPGPIPDSVLIDQVQIVVSDPTRITEGRDFHVFSPITWRVADFDIKRALLLAGAGWGILPEHIVGDDLTARRLVRLAPLGFGAGNGEAEVEIHVAWPADAALAPGARFFVSALASDASIADSGARTPSQLSHAG
jgi:DNA-binding transcriptional LysR family regulator